MTKNFNDYPKAVRILLWIPAYVIAICFVMFLLAAHFLGKLAGKVGSWK